MKRVSHQISQNLWAKVVTRNWLNVTTNHSAYAPHVDDDSGHDSDSGSDEEFSLLGKEPRIRANADDATEVDCNDALPILRRRNSETFRAQYIDTKEVRVCAATWNVGGVSPPEDLDIDDWIEINDPADIYVLGLQEVVPLNPGNILRSGADRPAAKWENIIRDTLNKIRPKASRIKSYSDPPSPGRFKPSEDVLESDSDVGLQVHPLDEEESDAFEEPKHDEPVIGELKIVISEPSVPLNSGLTVIEESTAQFSFPRKLDRLTCLRIDHYDENSEGPPTQTRGKTLNRLLSSSERIGLSWPEPPLNLLSPSVEDGTASFKSVKSFRATKSFNPCASTKSEIAQDILALADVDLESLMKRKRRPAYVRLVSKQMVGIYLTVWVRRSLRKHIQNVRVSTVGVGVMGYMGNKGAVSVSMSIHQTFFCFICSHLTAGERDVDQQKRNADVHEIHKRTIFHSVPALELPKLIYDHERIVLLGDLNYRISLSYEKTRELISKREWSQLQERDQLVREFRKGRAFDGWSEGRIEFAPTYKYDMNSDRYNGEEAAKPGRRTPAWCDRILSYGKGMKLTSYRRSEHKLSDHRPVTATYRAEVEVFSARKLQRALTFTDAEVENGASTCG